MTGRTKAFAAVAAVLGTVQLFAVVIHWHVADIRPFLIYLALVSVCSFFHLKRPDGESGLSLSLPFLLMAIVDLSVPEAVAIGCASALLQALTTPHLRKNPPRILFFVAIQATVIATACAVADILLPVAWKTTPVRLLFAAIALFVSNTFPAAIALRLNQQQRLVEIWRQHYFWLFPYYLIGGAVAQAIQLGRNSISNEMLLMALPAVWLAYRHYRVQKTELEARQKQAGEISALHLRAIESLAAAVEAKDNPGDGGHLRRVQVYALGIGRELGLSGDEMDALHAAVLLRDVGKLGIPDHLLNRAGKLTPDEQKRFEMHPAIGAGIVDQMRFPYPVAPLVRAHHENWDGTGYPANLRGESIPLAARIISAAEQLDMLRTVQQPEEAAASLELLAGSTLDPKLVATIRRILPQLEKQVLESKSAAELAAHDQPAGQTTQSTDFLSIIAAARLEEQVLRELSQVMARSIDIRQSLKHLDDGLRQLISYDAMAVYVLRGDTLSVEYSAGYNSSMLSLQHIPLGEGITGQVAATGVGMLNADPAGDPGFDPSPRYPLESALLTPIAADGQTVGVLAIYHHQKDHFKPDELRVAAATTPDVATTIQNALAFGQSCVATKADPLTGLPNTEQTLAFIDEAIEHGREHSQGFGVMIASWLDSDEVSRKSGPEAAAAFVNSLGSSLRQLASGRDHVGRVGPETFALVIPGMRREDLIMRLAQIDTLATEEGRKAFGQKAQMSVVEVFYPEDGATVQELLIHAQGRIKNGSRRWLDSIAALNAQTAPMRTPLPA